MNIAVFGTGIVGTTMASKLISLGQQVTLGSRTADNENGQAWLRQVKSDTAAVATYADAAASAELLFNCTAGIGSLEALRMAGSANLAGKILVDLSNPLDFSQGMPPRLFLCNDTSLGEQIQEAFPDTKVVKTLNTINISLMVEPQKLSGDHTLFISGNDAEAKRYVEQTVLRAWLGWPHVIDLGDIATARGTEMFLPLWLRMYGALGTTNFNIAIVK